MQFTAFPSKKEHVYVFDGVVFIADPFKEPAAMNNRERLITYEFLKQQLISSELSFENMCLSADFCITETQTNRK